MTKIRGDKPIGIIIQYTWKYPKETPCVATFVSNKQNVMAFFFFFYKIGEEEFPYSGRGRWWGKGIKG
jgi:hypothetical protein